MFKHIYSFIDKAKAHLNQKGQGMVEYALILALVAVIAVGAFNTSLGKSISDAFNKASNKIDAVGNDSTGTPGG